MTLWTFVSAEARWVNECKRRMRLARDLRDLNRTLIFERENWNRLYHEEGRKIVALEAALDDLLVLAERLGQGLSPADPAVDAARQLLAEAE